MNDEDSHHHSESAYDILKEFQIGALATSLPSPKSKSGKPNVLLGAEEADFDYSKGDPIGTDPCEDLKKHHFLNLDKPLLSQVLFGGYSKEFYLDEIHRPRHYAKGSALLFGNFLEPLSKTKWFVIPSLWLPCIAYGVSLALRQLSAPVVASLFLGGICTWTLVEYIMHRFLFHIDYYLPDHPLFLMLHFLMHGVHHYLPMDKERLVMPPPMFVTLAYPWWRLARLVMPFHTCCAFYSGAILGYVCYDCTHYFIHHKNLYINHLKNMKKYHLDHHYKDYNLGFGVTSKIWDVVFNTHYE